MTSVDDAANNLIYVTMTAGLSLATEAGIEMWAKNILISILDLVFTSLWITDRLLQSQRQDCWHIKSNHFPITTEVDVEALKGPPPFRKMLWKRLTGKWCKMS